MYVYIHILIYTVEANKFEHGCSMVYDGVPSLFGFRLEGGHGPSFLPLP